MRISVRSKSGPVSAFGAQIRLFFSHESRVRDRCEWEGVLGGASMDRTRPSCTEKQG
jgi:hypothetical protein